MHSDSLVRMVNQIGTFFETMPDRAGAPEAVAQHIRRFWDPRMRRDLLAHVDNYGTSELSNLVADVIRLHRGALF